VNRKGQTGGGAFGIILFLVLFGILFLYISPFLSVASDATANSSMTGVAGWFFGNFGTNVLLIFFIVVLWKIGV